MAVFATDDNGWTDQIAPCTAALTDAKSGIGLSVDDVRGFRAPYLEYSSELFGVLKGQGLWYDSSIQSCWGASDDGRSCAWPYTLDQGSADGVDLSGRFGVPSVPMTSGLWEMTPSVLFVPPDELATQYGFDAGLRQRIPSDMPPPSFYEAATGRIAPLDVTLFVDARLSAAEVLATLKYTLDLRLQGNRAPFIFISHSHVYASNYGSAPKAPSSAERQHAIEDFIVYALTKPVVRMRPVADIMAWMRHPEPLNGVITAMPPSAGAGSGGAAGGGGNSATGGTASSSAGALNPASGNGGNPAASGGNADNVSPVASPSCSCRVPRKAPSVPAALLLPALALARRLRRRSR